jgi:hypothetical protein
MPTEAWLPYAANPRAEARALLPLLRTMTAAEIIALIAVSEKDKQGLAKITKGSPTMKAKVEQLLTFRKQVGRHFQQLAARAGRALAKNPGSADLANH